nr:MAG TPA: hypothetical protein [Caudoviricetes sp.]
MRLTTNPIKKMQRLKNFAPTNLFRNLIIVKIIYYVNHGNEVHIICKLFKSRQSSVSFYSHTVYIFRQVYIFARVGSLTLFKGHYLKNVTRKTLNKNMWYYCYHLRFQ